MTSLPSVYFNSFYSRANGVSADGSAVVGYRKYVIIYPQEIVEAFLWTANDQRFDLGSFPGGGGSIAYAVSDDGAVVVGDGATSGDGLAFRWDRNHGMSLLCNGSALAISGDGRIVVGTYPVNAFIWDCVHGHRLLQAVLQNGYGIDVGGSLISANAISSNGRMIAGIGDRGFGKEPWMAQFPCRPGDTNDDGKVNGQDVQPFVDAFLDAAHASETAICASDVDVNNVIDASDIDTLVTMLLCE